MFRMLIVATILASTNCVGAEETQIRPINLPKQVLRTELIDALDQAIEAGGDEANASLFRKRARQLANGGQWKKAAVDLRRAIEREPGQLNTYQQAGAALLLGGDRMNYEQLVEEFLAAQKDNDNIFSREKQAKLCVLPQSPIGEQEDVKKWIEEAVANSDGGEWAAYFPATQAFAFYRYEEYDAALRAILETDRRHAIRGGSNRLIYARTRLIEAMCHAKTGNLEKAVTAFKKADDILRPHLTEADLVLKRQYWHDWMFGKLMHDEACVVLQEALAKAKQEE